MTSSPLSLPLQVDETRLQLTSPIELAELMEKERSYRAPLIERMPDHLNEARNQHCLQLTPWPGVNMDTMLRLDLVRDDEEVS